MFFLVILGAVIVALVIAIMGAILSGGSKNPPLREAELQLAGQVFRVELARTVIERVRGLSGREGLEGGDGSTSSPHRGMLFIFDAPAMQSFWMKGMKFPIDIIWIKDARVVGFAEDVEPEPGLRLDGVATATQAGKSDFALRMYSSPEPVDKVLEVRAGMVALLGIKVGDEVLLSL